MAATTTQQRLALAIIDFLNSSLTDGTLSSDDAESIEIAQNCLSECFKVDPTDKAAIASATRGQNLLQIYGVYEKLRGKSATSPIPTAAGEKSAAAATPASSTSSSAAPTEAQKKEAESLKSQGNAAMAAKNYPLSIELYTKALALVPGNPIFLSNRAAAYSASKDHESAEADAEAAVAADPKYTKAWSRLGLARFALGNAKGSMEAYQKGIDFEGSGGSDAMRKGFETAKRRAAELEAEGDDDEDDDATLNRGAGGPDGGGPDLSSLAGMFGGGGAGGGGGMPDLSSIMNNPMFASMAQNLMSNPAALNSIMSNPRLREMASQFSAGGAGGGGGGGGLPDITTMMQDPAISDLAKSLLGGGGAGRGGGGGAGAGAGAGASGQ